MRSRHWKLTSRVLQYAVYGTAITNLLLTLIGVPSWVPWALLAVTAVSVVAAYGCVWMYGRVLRREGRTRIPDLGDIARHFDSRTKPATPRT